MELVFLRSHPTYHIKKIIKLKLPFPDWREGEKGKAGISIRLMTW
jgi:hypothetical protein